MTARVVGIKDEQQIGLAKEFLYTRTGTEEPVYVFKHALTQDVAYESLLTSRRQHLHTAAAQALETLYADRLPDAYDRLAYHYARTTEAQKAVTYLRLTAILPPRSPIGPKARTDASRWGTT
jgi:predicted ATPase